MDQDTVNNVKNALVPAAINAVMNGWTSWGQYSGSDGIALSVDSIASGSHTAIGNAVMLATALGLVLSLINFAMARRGAGGARQPGAVRAAFGIAFKNAFFLFGLFVATGVVWQRIVGTVEVGPLAATALAATVGFGVSFYLYFAVQADHASFARRG